MANNPFGWNTITPKVSPTFPPFMSHRYCEHDLPYIKIDEKNVELIVLGTDTLLPIYTNCISKHHIEPFAQVDQTIQEHGRQLENDMVYTPLPDEICMAKLDNGEWRRCKYIGADVELAAIYCVDYGVVCAVKRDNIRVII